MAKSKRPHNPKPTPAASNLKRDTVPVGVSLPPDLLEKVDRLTQKNAEKKVSRSDIIVALLRKSLG